MAPLPPTRWNGHELRWGDATHVMAILNLTPDSFSGDGLPGDTAAALAFAERAVDEGADILDLGAESTRPGHAPISAAEEMERLLPVLTAIRARTNGLHLGRHQQSRGGRGALQAGADLVNDVRGFVAEPEMAAVVAAAGCRRSSCTTCRRKPGSI